MRAVVITSAGGPEVLEVRDVPRPVPQDAQVLVRVRAAALNRADVLQRQGRYPAPPGVPPDIPGLEFAGEVAETGPNSSAWCAGQRVMGIVAGGAQAEFLLTHERCLAEIPAALDFAAAAGIPEAFITAHDALWVQARLRPSETVLIHAVGSGVGLAAVQLARALGAIPFGTSRTADKIESAREFGLADGVALSSPEKLPEAVDRFTGGRGVDVIVDLVGGAYVAPGLRALATHGRYLCVGTVAGGRAEIELKHVLGQRLEIRGTVLRARPLEEKIAVTQAFARQVVPLFAHGTLRAVIDRVFPLAEVAAAHQHLESNETFGKVVLQIGD
jgi:NADPH2:quinone reductase